MLYSTALRRDESLSLEHTDLDRERGTLLVRSGKGKKDRFVPIGQRALAWLEKYLAEARPLLARHAETPLVFVSKNGHRLHANHLSKIVRDYLRGAGISKPARVIYSGIRQQLSCSKPGRTSATFKRCSVTRSSVQPRSTCTSPSRSCGKCTSARIRRVCSACPTAPQPPATDHPDEDDDSLEWVPIA